MQGAIGIGFWLPNKDISCIFGKQETVYPEYVLKIEIEKSRKEHPVLVTYLHRIKIFDL